MNEEWKDIEGYKNLYQISNLGRVRSLDRISFRGGRLYHLSGKILRQNMCTSGYMSVMLYDSNHETKRIMVHRLVAKTFIPNPDNLPEVNHKDENKLNNCADNLEWCTNLYNVNYGNAKTKWRMSMEASNAWSTKTEAQKQQISSSMKAHIAMRKATGTYWFKDHTKI